MNYTFEKNKLYSYLGERLVNMFKKHKVIIAGGTLTSLFSNREINDIDIYFRNEESVTGFIYEIWNTDIFIVSHTDKATLLTYNDKGIDIQAIHFKYFDNVEEIFNTFDFTVCMGAYDFSKEEFILHNDFMKHNSQRILKFNNGTSFPIVSLLRVQKYKDKGYTISKPEFIRIILTCMNLNIDSYEELKEQVGGMYGEAYDKLFEDTEDKEFSLQDAIDRIANLSLDDSYFNEPTPIVFNNLEDILDTIVKKPVKYIKINENFFKINHDGFLKKIENEPKNGERLDAYDFFAENKLYKFVKKENDMLTSFYNGEFVYEIQKEVTALNDDRNNGKLYFNEKSNILDSHYYHKNRKALIEVVINPNNLINAKQGVIEVKSCYVLREVPEEEWKKWIK